MKSKVFLSPGRRWRISRSATVTAVGNVDALEITKASLERIFAKAPDLLDKFGAVTQAAIAVEGRNPVPGGGDRRPHRLADRDTDGELERAGCDGADHEPDPPHAGTCSPRNMPTRLS